MKIRSGILRCFVAFTFVGLASQMICRAQLFSINSITNNANVVGAFFGVPLTLPSATNPANYTVYAKTGAISIASVAMQTNGQVVTLTLATNVGEFFYLNVSNLVDIASNTVDDHILGFISDFGNSVVGTGGDPSPAGQVITARAGAFDITTSGTGVAGTNDHFRFVYQPVISNFDMTVQATRLDQTSVDSQAGLMAREFLTPGSRTIQTYFTPTSGTNEIQSTMRTATNGTTTSSGFQVGGPPSATPLRWLRLTRTNNLFTAYHGSNGVDWTVSAVTTQAFASTLNIGMMVSSRTNGTNTTASFTDFGTAGVRPGDDILPTLSVVPSGTNLAFTWNRTPRDFTMIASTNLIDWALVLAPILEAGTNASSRLMNIPSDFYSTPSFWRLTRVERVIPDPPLSLETGLVISLLNGNAINTNANTLCSFTVTNAITQTNMNALPFSKVTFSTASQTPDSLDTVLRVRWLPATSPPCDDDSAGLLKSLQRFTNSATRTNFTLIVAVKTNTPTTPTLTIKVAITVVP